ncbi:MAG: hypothetical protein M3P04_03540, partial [Actinomycetota bacterium]|nr:hypothetical protein [Actinomycetota bacterium]
MGGKARLARLRGMLPQGGRLPEDIWRSRHHGILWLLWAHTALIPAYGASRGYGFRHLVLETSVVG